MSLWWLWQALFPWISLQQNSVITFLSVKAEVGSRGCPWAGTNGSKIKFSCKWRKDEVVIACSHILTLTITVTALSDNFFVNKIKGGVKGWPMSRHKWGKMAKKRIYRLMAGSGHFALFVPVHGQPLDPTSAFIDKNVITRCCCSDSYRNKAIPGYYHPIFPPFAWRFNFLPFCLICACSWATPWPQLCFYWQKCYHWELLQWYL